MKIRAILAALAVTLSATANAVVIEGFEHNNTGLYTFDSSGGLTLNNFTITGAAAHDGSFGAEFTPSSTGFAGWNYRTDVPTMPGNVYSAFVRFAGGATTDNQRAYVGFGASSSGCYSMVAAPNTSQVVLQQNAAFGFATLASAAFTYAMNTWYQIEVSWASNGDMTVSLWNEPHTSMLAQTATTATGNTTAGGIAFRGFNNSVGATGTVQVDTYSTPVPEPASLIAIGAGLLALARRKRK